MGVCYLLSDPPFRKGHSRLLTILINQYLISNVEDIVILLAWKIYSKNPEYLIYSKSKF